MSKPFSTKLVEELSYEEAFAELESIVNALEGEGSRNPLEEAMALFERGQALVKRCSALLDEAELKVRQLSGTELVEYEDEEP